MLLLNAASFILYLCCNKNIAIQPKTVPSHHSSTLETIQPSFIQQVYLYFTYYLIDTGLKGHETRGFLRTCLLDITPQTDIRTQREIALVYFTELQPVKGKKTTVQSLVDWRWTSQDSSKEFHTPRRRLSLLCLLNRPLLGLPHSKWEKCRHSPAEAHLECFSPPPSYSSPDYVKYTACTYT